MKRRIFVIGLIICSLLTACGQTVSASVESSVENSVVVSETVSENELVDGSKSVVSKDNEEDSIEIDVLEPSLKDYYTNWSEAYLDCMDYIIWLDCNEIAEIHNRQASESDYQFAKGYFCFDIIYLDADDTPELFVTTTADVGGCWVITLSEGRPIYNHFCSDTIRYVPHLGYAYSSDGYYTDITSLNSGIFNIVMSGAFRSFHPENDKSDEVFEYYLNEKPVSESEYNSAVSKYMDMSCAVTPKWQSYDDARASLQSSLLLGFAEEDGYTEWARVYLQYIKEIPANWYKDWGDDAILALYNSSFALIYLDNNDIPELFISSNTIPYGEMVVTVSNGNAAEWYLSRDSSYYIPRKGYIENNIREGLYIDRLENGVFKNVAEGVRYEHIREEDKQDDWFTWNHEVVTREKFYSNMARYYDKDKLVYLHEKTYPYWEMVSILKKGQTTSANHRYEAVVADVTREEAFEQAKEKGGYLAVLTTDEEYEAVAKSIEKQGALAELYYVAGRKTGIGAFDFSVAWTDSDGKEEIDYMPDKHYYWDEWGGNWIDNGVDLWDAWFNQWGGNDKSEYGVLKYNKELSSVFLNFALDDITPLYKGRMGYIIEFDD